MKQLLLFFFPLEKTLKKKYWDENLGRILQKHEKKKILFSTLYKVFISSLFMFLTEMKQRYFQYIGKFIEKTLINLSFHFIFFKKKYRKNNKQMP